jgi:hypothetical protein
MEDTLRERVRKKMQHVSVLASQAADLLAAKLKHPLTPHQLTREGYEQTEQYIHLLRTFVHTLDEEVRLDQEGDSKEQPLATSDEELHLRMKRLDEQERAASKVLHDANAQRRQLDGQDR